MDQRLIDLLNQSGYIFIQKPKYVIVKKKVVRSVGELLVFLIPGVLLISFGVFFLPGIRELGIAALILGMVLLYVPFFGYVSAPYRGLTINIEDRNMLFRSKMSRAYKFSEIDALELVSDKSDADTNPFSDSNKEYRYRLNVRFVGNVKEELFKFSEDHEIKTEVNQIKSYFKDVFD